ncbi:hypothetical protein [Accumulibacter sp.]|jgi:hypothetical protein|uniref:hypothetical protein n=1 Tax=Accumulibacter sp. TaxID=2053492 RepID=UPI001AD26830|nr:hypothetical protein [Accumulibacter sp.]MBN8452329.1 hypothetical protein [Accumulibacter sp.]
MKTTNPIRPLLVCLLGALIATQTFADSAQREATKLRMTEGKALFEEKCKTVAGEKVYKTVPEVEGLLLMKIRPPHDERQQSDLMWPGAAFAREATVNGYIDTFLAYEYPTVVGDKPIPIAANSRGYINTQRRPGGLPGYRWVEVLDENDGKRYRVTGSQKAVGKKDTSAYNVQLALKKDPDYDLNVYQWSLDKSPAPGASPRYGVTFEDHVIPEERKRGLASSTVKVLDLKTGEVLGEMLRYAWSPGAPSPANPTPWLTAYRCPNRMWTGADTRQFVDQVLIPAKEQ